VRRIDLSLLYLFYSGLTLEDDAELAIIEKMVEDFKPTWGDRLIALGIIVEFVLLLILLLRKGQRARLTGYRRVRFAACSPKEELKFVFSWLPDAF
jgi:hypothetical protein